MKIVHVVTYIDKDGSFGGPVAVSIAQLANLAAKGHDVELIAATDGLGNLVIPGVKVSLFRGIRLWPGFTGILAPRLYAYLYAQLPLVEAVHIHLGRDLITLAAAIVCRMRKANYVVQTHGMVMPDPRRAVAILDGLLTRRVLMSARRIFVLTAEEAQGIERVAPKAIQIERIANGLAETSPSTPRRDFRELLFLARLHPRKRVLAFVEMCRLLRDQGVEFHAAVVGPDEGDLTHFHQAVERYQLHKLVRYEGAIGQGMAVERLAGAGIFVLPSTGEVFPMTVLESFVASTPVVTTSQSGMAQELEELGAAIITDGSPKQLAEAVEKILLDDGLRQRLVQRGAGAIQGVFSIESVAKRLEAAYASPEG